MNTDAERSIGRVEGRLGALEDRVGRDHEEMVARLGDMAKQMDAVLETLHGWSGMQRLGVWLLAPIGAGAVFVFHLLFPNVKL